MKLATLLRYCDLKQDPVWDNRYYIMHDYEILARENKVGLCAIMTEFDLEEMCEGCDGLIIPGSATDIDPKYYGGKPLDPPQEIDEYGFDAKVIKCFEQAGKPIFGVCGGFQELNVYFGGSIKKIPMPGDPHQYSTHNIDIASDSFVYDVFGSETATINSYHSWMLDRVAPCFDVVAKSSEDGIIEAIECKEKKIFAVEWHPEQSYHTGDRIENKFFENFIECCRKNSEK